MKAGLFAFFITILFTLPSTLSAQDSADGLWDFVMSGPAGEVTAVVDLVVDGSTVIGQFDLGDGRVWPISNGTVNGDTISFDLVRGDSGVTYQMSATIQGDQASGKATAMGTTAEWTMTRAG
ncbi:MAG: hypothetical protein Q7W55_03505 [Pseudohongiella sp.]|nr:hypothetical protein [Pseudohongiella sp.]MDP2127387.1 hypothetical protein [Pseudohongiella sp.]